MSQHSEMLDDVVDRIYIGSAAEVLRDLPPGIVQCAVTSPPYFGHRRYGDESIAMDEIGREPTIAEYVEKLVEVFQQVKRVMRDNGTLWLNLGDTYRNGQMLGVPWRVALALQEDGWLLRSDVIWHKPNAMPSSVKSRPTCDHEYLFLFSKSPKYHYDQDAIREPHKTFTSESKMRGGRGHFGKRGAHPKREKMAAVQTCMTGGGIRRSIR